MEIKTKINKWDLIKLKSFWTEKLLDSKGNYKQSEKAAFRMGENNSIGNWQKNNLQNMQAVHIAQYQKNEQFNKKVGKRTKQTFLQRRHTDG